MSLLQWLCIGTFTFILVEVGALELSRWRRRRKARREVA